MPFFPLTTLETGLTVQVDTADITYVEPNLADPLSCFVGVVGAPNFSRLLVNSSYVATITAAHLASGIVVGGYPFAPYIQVLKPDGSGIVFQGATVATLASVAADPTLCTIDTNGSESPWLVVADPNTLAVDLTTASGSTGAPAQNRIQLLAFLDPNGIALFPSVSDFGTTITPTVPHVPGSGFYEFTLGGAGVPSAYLPQIGVFAEVCAQPIARQIAPGSPSFIVDFRAPSRVIAAASIDPLGFTIGNINLLCANVGPGVYDLSMPTSPQGGVFNVTASLSGPLPATNAWAVDYTGPNTFTIRITDMSTVTPINAAFSVHVVTAEDGSGNNGYQRTDPYFSVMIVNADP
jgi:hypothetical protein